MISVPMRLLSLKRRWQAQMDEKNLPNTVVPRTPSGAVIWCIALYMIWTGWFNYVQAAPPPPGRARSLSFIEAGPLGPDFFGYVMVFFGIVALFFSYCRRGSVESVALPVVAAFSLMWGLVFFVSWVFYDATFSDVRALLGTWWILIFGVTQVVQRRMKGGHC